MEPQHQSGTLSLNIIIYFFFYNKSDETRTSATICNKSPFDGGQAFSAKEINR